MARPEGMGHQKLSGGEGCALKFCGRSQGRRPTGIDCHPRKFGLESSREMGSFGKNRRFSLPPLGDFHGQRRGDGLSPAHPRHPLQLGHRATHLPLQPGPVAPDFIQHLTGGQDSRRLFCFLGGFLLLTALQMATKDADPAIQKIQRRRPVCFPRSGFRQGRGLRQLPAQVLQVPSQSRMAALGSSVLTNR